MYIEKRGKLDSILTLAFALLLSTLVSATPSLERQYQDAYLLATTSDGFVYNHSQAIAWARRFIEKKAVFPANESLLQYYQRAYLFAVSREGLRLGPEAAIAWARDMIIRHFRYAGRKNLALQLNDLLNFLVFQPGEAEPWTLAFLLSDVPLYSASDLRERYREIFEWLRSRPEFSYDADKSRQTALEFIRRRYWFVSEQSLSEQYLFAYQFAIATDGLEWESDKAEHWAKIFISERGRLDPESGLGQQYAQAYALAYSELQMDDEQARAWALQLLKTKSAFSEAQNLFDQYREAFLFAYQGDFLKILHQRQPPANVFLRDYAEEWAKNFINTRARLSQKSNVIEQYRQALDFAYSSLGLKLELEAAYVWARQMIERERIFP